MSDNEIINSQSLKQDVERESGKPLIESNGGLTRYSGRDKSYSNLFEFFINVGKSPSDTGGTEWSRLSSKEKLIAVLKAIIALVISIGFIIFVLYIGGRVGLIIGIPVIFAVWLLVHYITKRRRGQ